MVKAWATFNLDAFLVAGDFVRLRMTNSFPIFSIPQIDPNDPG